jgi:ABC-2 type transport system ATP-binding protein
MIVAEHLSKRYGDKQAVADVSFTVRPGAVTGFLGPNGAGKSTIMRLIVGLDRPTGGRVTVAGRDYARSPSPLTEVGALLDAKAAHQGRSARSHLRALAATHGIPDARVDEVIAIAGLGPAARKRISGFSFGMGQRLGIAAALLGDPDTLILDEPVNGLDPEGVRWVRQFVRALAAEGRTVLLSSHLMSEMEHTADHVIVLGRGRVLAAAPLPELVRRWTATTVRVRSPQLGELTRLLQGPGVEVRASARDTAEVGGLAADEIARRAAAHSLPIYELAPITGSLEEAYLALTHGAVEYQAKEIS